MIICIPIRHLSFECKLDIEITCVRAVLIQGEAAFCPMDNHTIPLLIKLAPDSPEKTNRKKK